MKNSYATTVVSIGISLKLGVYDCNIVLYPQLRANRSTPWHSMAHQAHVSKPWFHTYVSAPPSILHGNNYIERLAWFQPCSWINQPLVYHVPRAFPKQIIIVWLKTLQVKDLVKLGLLTLLKKDLLLLDEDLLFTWTFWVQS